MLGGNDAFVTSKDESTLEVTPGLPVWNIDPFIRIKKRTKVATMQLELVPQSKEEDEDEEEIWTTMLWSARNTIASKPDPRAKLYQHLLRR